MIIRGKRILIAEDEPQVRHSIAMLLDVDDHIVTEAQDGAEALALFTEGKFDLVMTDFEMPVMKGDMLAFRIKQLVPEQPVVMVTAWPEKITPEMRVDGIVAKPFTMADLRGAIAKVFR